MNMALAESPNGSGEERCVSYGRGGAGNLRLLAPLSLVLLAAMLTEMLGRRSEVVNSEGIVDVDAQRRRRSSVWSRASSQGEGRRASIIKAAALILGRRSSVGDEEVVTKGED